MTTNNNQPNAAEAAALPAEVREALINTIYQPGFWQRKEPVTELCAALAPLWPKPAPSAPDVQRVAEEIARLDSIQFLYPSGKSRVDITAILTRFAAELTAQKDAEIARLNKACDAFSNAEILSGDWKARAEKAEAERDQLRTQLEAWHSLFGTTQLSHAIAERDQLRAEVQAKQHAIDAAAAQIAQLSAKEGTRHA